MHETTNELIQNNYIVANFVVSKQRENIINNLSNVWLQRNFESAAFVFWDGNPFSLCVLHHHQDKGHTIIFILEQVEVYDNIAKSWHILSSLQTTGIICINTVKSRKFMN